MKRFAYPIFCDDIRNEVNGKISLMGIFGSVMYLSEFPAMLPKLCVLVTAHTSADRPFESITFKGTIDKNVAFEVSLDKTQMDEMVENGARIDDPKGFDAKAIAVLSPLHLAGPAKIEITVFADGEEIECGGLQIDKAPEGLVIVQ